MDPRARHLTCVVQAVLLLGSTRAHAQAVEPGALRGHAIAVDGQIVVVDFGREDGVSLGDRVAFSVPTLTDLGGDEIAYADRLAAVGEVRAVSSHRVRVRLGTNERVDVGTQATLTTAPLTRSLIAPPPSGARTQVEVGIRLVGTVGASGGGALVDARLDRRLGARGFLRLRIDPTGVVGYRREDPDRGGPEPRPPGTFAANTNAVALVGFDTGPLAMGAGVGVTMTTRLDETFTCPSCDTVVKHHGFEPGLTFATMARFGLHDGLSMEVDTAFVAIQSRIEMSRFAARVDVPVTPSLTFVARGSGGFGVVGTRIVEIGARMLTHGNGHGHSVYLEPHIGYAAVAERADLRTTPSLQPRPHPAILVHGLTLGFTVEARY